MHPAISRLAVAGSVVLALSHLPSAAASSSSDQEPPKKPTSQVATPAPTRSTKRPAKTPSQIVDIPISGLAAALST